MDVDRLEKLTSMFETALELREYDIAEQLLPIIGEETHEGFVGTLRRVLDQARTDKQ